MVTQQPIQALTLTAQTYKESLRNDESALDGHSDSLYRVLTLTAQTYMEALLKDISALDDHSKVLQKDGSAPDSHFDNLYWSSPKTYTEDLLKDSSAHDGHSDSLYWVITLMTRPTMNVLQNDGNTPNNQTQTSFGRFLETWKHSS